MVKELNETNEKNALVIAMSPLFFLLSILMSAALAFSGCDTGGEDDVTTGSDGDVDRDTGIDTHSSATSEDSNSDTGTDSSMKESPYTTALVTTSDYQTGAYSTISLDGHVVKQDIYFIHSDAVCRFEPLTGTPFIIQRLGSDAIDVLDATTFEIQTEYSVGASSNPYDIQVIGNDRAFVSLFALPEILIVNPFTGVEVGTVDLSAYADADGIPEASAMILLGAKVYVAVSRIDRDNGWEPAGKSYLVVINAATGGVEGAIELAGTNPVGSLEYSPELGRLVVTQVGSYGTLDDGGVQLVDPAAQTVGDFVVTEQALGGSLNKTVCVTETKCYAVIGVAGDNGSNTHLVTFDPQTGAKAGTLAEGSGWVFSDIALTPDSSELWLADGTAENPGIRIFDATNDAEKTAMPISVGLPPTHICFTR